jgi:hypothetical protein
MSTSLTIRLAGPVLVAELLESSRAALKCLLNLVSECPPLIILELDEGIRCPFVSPTIDQASTGAVFLVTPEGRDETVSLVTTKLADHPSIPESERGPWINATVGATRDSLEYALAAALAASVARLLSEPIVDDALFWTDTYEQSSEAFVERLKLRETSSDLVIAADAFFGSLARA